MIYILILLDVLINNYTKYTSFFFIVFLYNKPYKYFLLNGLILDLVIFNSFLINTIILLIIYYIDKIFKDLNKNNIYNYIFINTFNYLLFIFLSNMYLLNNFPNGLIILGKNLLINITFYVLFFRVYKNSKKI